MEIKQVNNRKKAKQSAAAAENKQILLARPIIMVVLGIMLLSGAVVFASKGSKQLVSYFRPSVKVTLSGSVSRDGGAVELSKAGFVKPGEILNWKIVSENKGDGVAKGYNTIGQVPVGTEFVAGSANGDDSAVVKYSVDRGKSFSEKPMVRQKQADGSEKLVPAPVSMYTQVQFVWENSLDSGKKLNASYSVRVK